MLVLPVSFCRLVRNLAHAVFRSPRSSHKTRDKMNGETGKIVRLGVLMGFSALVVAGCSTPFSAAQVDPSSPVAAATQAATHPKGRRPTFADIPPIPTDVRAPAAYRGVIAAQEAAGDKLRRDTAPETFVLKNTETYAARARAAGKAPNFEAPTDADRAETAAFAKAARGRASAPSSQPK
jgi:hypothetical protein